MAPDSVIYFTLRAAARVALRWHYSDILVQGAEHVPLRGPVIVAANHPNALVDALLVSVTLARRVRLTAKATLFEHSLLAPLLRLVGVVPLHRAKDGRAAKQSAVPVERNAEAFRVVVSVLRAQGVVLVFPEGISHDAPALAPLRTGAARMALEAAAAGIEGVCLLPMGLVFEQKERPRSRVLVRIGEPIAIGATSSHHVAAVTRTLDDRLRALTLNFATEERATRAIALARVLARLGEQAVVIRTPLPLADEVVVASRIEAATAALDGAPPELAARADAFVDRVDAFEQRFAGRGVSLLDLRVSTALAPGARFVVREGAILLAGAPIALLGRFTHWLPIRVARALAMRTQRSDPSRDQPAMRTIVFGLILVIGWYLLQAVLVAHWLGPVIAGLWVTVIFIAARLELRWHERVGRAARRARSYLALRRDAPLHRAALVEAAALLDEAVALERMLIGVGP
ncbi:MAG: 1-acyl-sn-glycerol-3-phosphate acyltransferase [Gemmatimonadaceae bacterium]|nr:1-acyl-sn-glycerol-3-phosphate acyltransferase [Gemmatimonadaceae bacterium]